MMQVKQWVNKYKKDELVKYLSSMYLFEQNSPHIIQLSTLMYNALYCEGGETKLKAADLERDIKIYYPYEETENPQSFMYVDTVHCQKGTYRVFPGNFAYVHYNLTRLFMIAMTKQIHEDMFGEVYALLELSDQIAERCGYGRYEGGDSGYGELYCPDNNHSEEKQKVLTFTQDELTKIFEEYGQNWEVAKNNIYQEDKDAIERFFNIMDSYSPVEKMPFYQLSSGEYVVMEPSALLTSAYLRCLTIMRAILHEDDLQEINLELVKSECHRAIKYANNMCKAAEKYGGVSCLVYHFDVKKVARICFSSYHDFNEGLRKSDEMVAKKCAGLEVMKIHIITSLDFENPIAFPFDEIVLTADDFKIIMGNEHGMLTTLYDYYKSRLTLKGKTFGSDDADMYGYYCHHKRTFYQEQEVHLMNIAPDFYFTLKCDYLQKRDQHLIDYEKQKVMVRHIDELPKELSIYEPDTEEQTPMLVGEFRTSSVVICFEADNKDEYRVLREISKALLVRFFVFEYRHKEPLLKTANYWMEVCFVDGMTVLFNIKPNDLLFSLSRKFFENDYHGKTDEQALVEFVMEKMNHYGYICASDYLKKNQQIFDECKGQIFLTEHKGLEYWQVHDQYDSTYKVNEHLCDEVLDEIANHLNRKGKDQPLTLDESKVVAYKVVEYIVNELNKLLAQYSSKEFVLHLLQLHHATLFWLATTSIRFEKVNLLMEYIGTHFDGQKELLFEYSETNNLTQCLIERIVSNDFCTSVKTKDFPLETIERIYAYMHTLYNFGIYIDLLNEKLEGIELTILANGRVALPIDIMEDVMKYFQDLRHAELYNPNAFRILSSMKSGLNIDVESDEFKEAFKDEFKIDYSQWGNVLIAAVDYSLTNKKPIVVLSENDFDKNILLKVLDAETAKVFKQTFFMSKDMKCEDAQKHDSFVQRFNRRYQLSSRPWICYQGSVYYSIKSLHQSEHVMMERLNEGKVNATSEKMKAYIGAVNEKKGIDFNDVVYNLYAGLKRDGLHVYKEVKVGPGERLKAELLIGDFDILIIDETSKQIVCVEAKDYIECRTIYELILEERKVKKALKKVKRRDEWAKNHVESFKDLTDKITGDYSVKTIFVTAHMPAHKYLGKEEKGDIIFVSALDIAESPEEIFDL